MILIYITLPKLKITRGILKIIASIDRLFKIRKRSIRQIPLNVTYTKAKYTVLFSHAIFCYFINNYIPFELFLLFIKGQTIATTSTPKPTTTSTFTTNPTPITTSTSTSTTDISMSTTTQNPITNQPASFFMLQGIFNTLSMFPTDAKLSIKKCRLLRTFLLTNQH